MKTPVLFTRGGIRLLSFAAAGFLPAQVFAQWEVQDAMTEQFCMEIANTATQIASTEQSINTNTAQISTNTDQIKSDTGQIRQDTGAIRLDVAQMRKVVDARQQMLLSMAQIHQLSDLGQVLAGGPTDDVIKNIDEALSNPGSIPNAIAPGAGGTGSVNGAATQAFTAGLLSGAQRSGQFQGIGNITYNGSNFVGVSWGDVSGIKTYLGGMLSDDEAPPVYMVIVSWRTASVLRNIQSRCGGGAPAWDTSSGGLLASTVEGRAAKKYMVAPGIAFRPQTRLDPAYYAMAIKGTMAARTQFLAAITDGDGATYDPFVGQVAPGHALVHKDNLNDVLSGGAYKAVAAYNSEHGITENPYSSFARSLAPILGQGLATVAPGEKFTPTANQIEIAKKVKPLDLYQFRPLAAADFSRENAALEYALDTSTMPIFQRCQLDLSAITSGSTTDIVVVTLPGADEEAYSQRIAASTTRLSQNQRMLNIQTAMLNYTQACLAAVGKLRGAYQDILNGATANGAVGELNLAIGQCDNMTIHLQASISQYATGIDGLMKTRHDLLSERANIVQDAREKNMSTANARIIQAVTNGGNFKEQGINVQGSSL